MAGKHSTFYSAMMQEMGLDTRERVFAVVACTHGQARLRAARAAFALRMKCATESLLLFSLPFTACCPHLNAGEEAYLDLVPWQVISKPQ